MAGEWRISADDRAKYETYFQQCGPMQGYLSGDQARNFFVKSSLPGDILRKIWDLSDLNSDGRLDKREFAIACHLISTQVKKQGPLPASLPPTLLSDAMMITTNGVSAMPTMPLFITPTVQPLVSPGSLLKSVVTPPAPITPTVRSKYLQQFHSTVDVTKTNGCMTAVQAKSLLQQTGLSQTYLHQIWNLADNDKDGRLTADEFVIAMHCCDILRAGQALPVRLPDEWLHANVMQRERISSVSKPFVSPAFAQINQELQDAFKSPMADELPSGELERKNSLVTYEEKRQRNYEDGYRELERRRQLLREQEEREHRERDERDRKREFDMQKHKEDQERRKQLEFDRQLERQRKNEQQREEERKKLLDQRESARKELERRSRLEWERQRMQELSTQKSRLLEQTNNLRSRNKALELEVQSMDETMYTCQSKIQQTNATIQSIDQSILDLQKRTVQERQLYEAVEQQRKDLLMRFNRLQAERESLRTSSTYLSQSKEFNAGSRESDQVKFFQTQIDTIKRESTRADEQLATMANQSKQYQNQMEQLRIQLTKLEQEAKTKSSISQVSKPAVAAFPTSDPFYANTSTNDFNTSSPSLHVDPFQSVDPFASQPVLDSPSAAPNNDWIQPSTKKIDPFLSNVGSPRTKKPAPKVNSKQSTPLDPWGESTSNNGNAWSPFNTNKISSPFGDATNDWSSTVSNGSVQYRALYDYVPERDDEMGMSTGDMITVDPQQQQDENWLFGKIGANKQGYFPAAYAERVTSSTNGSMAETNAPLNSGSWAMTLADYQGKTADKHLSFQKGELILVREQKDSTWYSGQLRGRVGWFPRNYVRLATQVEIENDKNLTPNTPTSENSLNSPNDRGIVWRQAPTVPNLTDVYEAIYQYEASDPSDLSFNVGERITVLTRDGDWWTGRIGERTGTFPNNYVVKVENSSTPSLQETAVATIPFHTQEEGRLSFEQGQVIYIRKKGDKGWYQGEIRVPDQPVRVGWFPANCVQAPAISSPTVSYLNTAENPRYIAIFPYEARQDDELSFPADAILEILDVGENTGWFKARLGNQVGLIPSTYVQPMADPPPQQ